MIVIKGEHLKVKSELFDHVEITSDNLVGVLYGLYEENDCEDFEDFLDYLGDESILVYIEKKGV